MTIPNFFIVGAAKSGTSSLWQYLKQNENVFMPRNTLDKEPAFFSPLKNRRTFEQYMDLFRDANVQHTSVGEASTAYLTDHTSAKNIYEFNPNARILIILRNPSDRAYSSYNWMVQEGYEYAGSFKKALKLEKRRAAKLIPNYWEPEYYWDYMYFRSGYYYEQVKKYLDLFKDNVLVVKFDDFLNNFTSEYDRICSFLAVSVNFVDPAIHNISRDVYSPLIQFALRKLSTKLIGYRIRYGNYQFSSKNDRDRLLKIGITERKPKPLEVNLRATMLQKYKSHIYKLSDLTCIDFNDWVEIH